MRSASMPVQSIRLSYSGSNVTSLAYTELTDSVLGLLRDCLKLEISDTSGQDMKLAIGASGAQVDVYNIFAGKAGIIDFHLGTGTHLWVRAQGTTASTGVLTLNFFY